MDEFCHRDSCPQGGKVKWGIILGTLIRVASSGEISAVTESYRIYSLVFLKYLKIFYDDPSHGVFKRKLSLCLACTQEVQSRGAHGAARKKVLLTVIVAFCSLGQRANLEAPIQFE